MALTGLGRCHDTLGDLDRARTALATAEAARTAATAEAAAARADADARSAALETRLADSERSRRQTEEALAEIRHTQEVAQGGLSALEAALGAARQDGHRLQQALAGLEAEHAARGAELYNATGRRRGSLADCLIAATCLRLNAAIATDNVADFRLFEPMGLRVLSSA